ncbi:MAG: ABC transporter permease [Halobacteriota archaeon]
MRGSLPIARRILLTLRGDRRTLAMVLVVPAFIIYLFSEVFPTALAGQRVAPVLLGAFVFLLTYLLTAIGFLRERQSGTLERVLVSPIRRREVVTGYVLGFGVLAVAQSMVLLGAGIYFLEVAFHHGIGPFIGLVLLGAFVGLGLGIVASLFAENEFQVQQLMPVVIAPQVILGNTFVPVEELVWYLEYPAWAMPVTHLVRGMEYVVLDRGSAGELGLAVAVLVVWTVGSIAAANIAVNRSM